MLIYVVWVLVAIAVGIFARTKGRNPVLWALLSVLFSPIIMGVVLAVLPDPREEQARRDEEMMEEYERSKAEALGKPGNPK